MVKRNNVVAKGKKEKEKKKKGKRKKKLEILDFSDKRKKKWI